MLPAEKTVVRSIKRQYSSRREKNYEESFDDYSGMMNTIKDNAIELKDQEGKISYLQPNPRFINYGQNFKSLLKQNCVNTCFPVINMIINYGSTRVIAVLK